MPKYTNMNQVANAFINANRIKSKSVQDQVITNFLNKMKNDYPTIRPEQIEFVDFDCICVVINDELIDIEI